MLRLLLIFLCAHVTTASLMIGAFNVKRLDNAKAGDAQILGYIAKILARYDISVVTEVMDTSAVQKLLDEMNRISGPFTMSVGPAAGRYPNFYQEHIAIIYRNDKMEMRGNYVYPDPSNVFEREPYTVSFHTTQTHLTDFAVMGVHLKPDDVPSEMDAVVQVYEQAAAKLGVQNMLIAGDFNADCSYLSSTQYHQSALWTDDRFYFHVYANADTTASHNTDCAYDRFVSAGSAMRAAVVPNSVHVYNTETELHLSYDLARDVSDHYPVELRIQ